MKVKKLISLIVSISCMVSCIGAFGVRAEEDFKIYYSIDGINWDELGVSDFEADLSPLQNSGSNFKVHFYNDGNDNNTIDILDKAQFLYVYANKDADFYTMMKNNGDAAQWFSAIGSAWDVIKVHFVLPVLRDDCGTKDNPLVVPFRAGRADVIVKYSGEQYFTQFIGRYAEAAQNFEIKGRASMFSIANKAGNVGYPFAMYGASVENDNQAYVCSYTNYVTPSGDEKKYDQTRMWTGANFSDYLRGSSFISMPVVGLSAAYSTDAVNKASSKYFSIDIPEDGYKYWGDDKISGELYTDEDGYAGEVVMMMYNPAADDSEYLNPESGWECVNNGTSPEEMDFEYEDGDIISISTDRDYSDYDTVLHPELNYYCTAIKWITSSFKAANTGTDGINKNKNRLQNVKGEISQGSQYSDAIELKYAYRKKFKAGDSIDIYSPANLESSAERQGFIIPIIKYYTPKNSVNNVEAYYDDADGKVYVHADTTYNYIKNDKREKLQFALFDASKNLIGTKLLGSCDTSDEFVFEGPSADGAFTLKLFSIIGDSDPEYEDDADTILNYKSIFYKVEDGSLNKVK